MSKEKILVVDDEKDIVELLQYNLEKEGYKISAALSGEQCLENIKIEMLYTAIPIVKNNQTLGIARLSLPLTEVNENISNLYKIIILATAIALIIASIISLIISLTITRPLQEMTKVSQKISKGDFSKKLKIHSQDEIGQLADSLNLMSEELENKIRIISEDKDKMEVVLSGVIEGIAAIDKEGRIILFNHALKNMIDCSSDRVLEKFHWEIIRNNQLNELLKEALQKGQALTREITLFSPQFPLIKADPEQIEVVFRNLLDNAVKYTPKGGEIYISALEKTENIYIEVADNGIGISAEHLPRIFERFYRADKDRSRKFLTLN